MQQRYTDKCSQQCSVNSNQWQANMHFKTPAITLRDAELKDAPSVVQLIAKLAATETERSPITETYVES